MLAVLFESCAFLKKGQTYQQLEKVRIFVRMLPSFRLLNKKKTGEKPVCFCLILNHFIHKKHSD